MYGVSIVEETIVEIFVCRYIPIVRGYFKKDLVSINGAQILNKIWDSFFFFGVYGVSGIISCTLVQSSMILLHKK